MRENLNFSSLLEADGSIPAAIRPAGVVLQSRRDSIGRGGQKARHEHDADDTKAEEFDWNDVEHEAHRVTLGDHIRTFGEDS